jgi:uncharacterized protein (TIGR04255 family)
MSKSRMKERPADLPDFKTPPVTEVVLGVQFNSLDKFLSPHLGLIWEAFKADFPKVEEQAPIPPTFETFGAHPQFLPGLNLSISLGGGQMPRVFFINDDNTQLIQVQKDRFIHNWRKVASGGEYPRFERMLENFELGFRKFADIIAANQLGTLEPNQCEVSYFNQIPIPEDGSAIELMGNLFAHSPAKETLDELGTPEDFRTLVRYVMRRKDGSPRGRLLVSCEPAWRADGVPIVQMTLTARGVPDVATIEGVSEFLQSGRIQMVKAFAKLTSARMHEKWGRTQ